MLTRLFRLALGATITLFVTQSVAQEFPTRPIRIVSPYAPGGGNDRVTRLLAEKLTKSLGQQIFVENRPGANTMLGNEYVAKSTPDGHTLVLNGNGFVINPSFYRNIPYDTNTDLIPVSFVAFSQLVLVASAAIEPNTVAELLAFIRANPNKLNFGTSGYGGPDHLACLIFNQLAKVQLQTVPYKGGGPAVADLLGNHVQLMMVALPIVQAHINSGKLKLLGAATKTRASAFPSVPTLDEAGLKGYEAFLWYGLMAPKHTPVSTVNKLAQHINDALKDPQTLEWFKQEGLTAPDAEYNTPKKFETFIHAELEKTAKLASEMKIQRE